MARRGGDRRWWRRAAFGLLTGTSAFVAISLYVEQRYLDRIVSTAEAPKRRVAIVFGAGLARGQAPGPVLAERLDAALRLYRAGKVEKLLMTGDNSDRFHDETTAMRRYAEERGVPAADLVGDYMGLSTYDSLVRAKRIFRIQAALLVTQRFHLPRALYIANAIGLDAHGVAADEGREDGSAYALRELLSRPLAFALVWADADPQFLGERVPLE